MREPLQTPNYVSCRSCCIGTSPQESNEPEKYPQKHWEVRDCEVRCKNYVGPQVGHFVGPGASGESTLSQATAL